MKLFSRNKSDTAPKALVEFGNHPAIKHLWTSTSLSREQFDTAYLRLLKEVLLGDSTDAERSRIIKLVHGLLVMRNGIILGKGLPIEDVSLIGNAFTFALVSAPLIDIVAQRQCAANDVPHTAGYSLAIANMTMGDAAFAWLSRNAVVLNDWIAYFVDPKNSEIRHAIDTLYARNPQLQVNAPALPDDDCGEIVEEPEEHVLPLSLQYLSWLRSKIESGEMSVNQPDSAIHITDAAEVFLIDPDALQVFADLVGKKPVTIRRRLARNNYLASNGKGNDVFYTIDDQVVKGIAITNAKTLFSDIQTASQFIVAQTPHQKGLFEEGAS